MRCKGEGFNGEVLDFLLRGGGKRFDEVLRGKRDGNGINRMGRYGVDLLCCEDPCV